MNGQYSNGIQEFTTDITKGDEQDFRRVRKIALKFIWMI